MKTKVWCKEQKLFNKALDIIQACHFATIPNRTICGCDRVHEITKKFIEECNKVEVKEDGTK